jgi:hypothetical protein
MADHGTTTRFWFQHAWTATTTAWVAAWAGAKNAEKNGEF